MIIFNLIYNTLDIVWNKEDGVNGVGHSADVVGFTLEVVQEGVVQIYINVLFFWANVSFLIGANVPFLEQMCQKSRGKCVIFRANVPYLTGANVLRANEGPPGLLNITG